MATSQDLMGVLGTIFVVIIILSLIGSMDSGKKHTTLIAPTRTIVQPPDVINVTRWGPRYPGYHHHHGSRPRPAPRPAPRPHPPSPPRPAPGPPHHSHKTSLIPILGPGGIQK